MSAKTITVDFVPTPEQVAEAFWNMGSNEQAEFYAHLYRIAGPARLCYQTAWILDGIRRLARMGGTDAREGFQTIHAHSAEYVSAFIDSAVSAARHGEAT